MGSIFIIGIFLSLFLMSLLLAKKQKSMPDKILAIWMFFIGLHLFSFFLHYLGYWEKYPHLVGIHHPFPLLYGPLLYLYVNYTLQNKPRFRRKDFIHFIPFFLSYLYMSKFLFTFSAEQKKISDQIGLDPAFRTYFIASILTFVLSGIIYPALSYKSIKRYKILIAENFGYDDHINLRWLQKFIHSIFFIYFIVLTFTFLEWVAGIKFNFDPSNIFFTLMVLFVVFLGYFGILQQNIFANDFKKEILTPKIKGEYQNSGLKETEAAFLHERLKKLMISEKPYLEPKLSLGLLSQMLETSPNHLSQVINQFDGKNFYDFINEYRVKEFIKIASLPHNKQFNILGLAYEAGFNSKSSFNQIFKKHTGKTPSEFLKNVTLNN